MSFLKGWRTRIIAVVFFAYGAIELLDPNLIADTFGWNAGGVIMSLAVIKYIMRQITDTPAGKKV